MLAPNYMILLIGVIITGIASGVDLPVSLTVVSRDSSDQDMGAKVASSTQIYRQAGIFISYICSFLVSKMTGVMGDRIVFAIFLVFAIITWLWRTFSGKFKQIHVPAVERISL